MTEEERKLFAVEVAHIVKASAPVLSDDETMWVRMAIKREAQSIALRQAIIEKSIAGLVWSGFLFIGYALLEWAKAHGYKA